MKEKLLMWLDEAAKNALDRVFMNYFNLLGTDSEHSAGDHFRNGVRNVVRGYNFARTMIDGLTL